MLFEVTDVDRQVYENEIRDFLPEKMIDIHTHVWLDRFKAHSKEAFSRVVQWPSLVAKEGPVEELIEKPHAGGQLCFESSRKERSQP